ncbi:hypothetical protein F3Y22_tig00110187pilonHSYRG00317 [Hibiscus syriacus]|uniref:Uncharacterized protein n=1 Tax=Hibiscus syriacus TaxID=106335 RepID=A0A6A3BD93_HIBSY|nr:hypothetical protein F3Y22_tig00110187pilonHSYRG00317 [Hibiscus syriacus]
MQESKEKEGLQPGQFTSIAMHFILMMELRKKIITFREIIDLPPWTMKDLHKISYKQILIYFCKTLQDLADISNMSSEGIDKCKLDINNEEPKSVEKLVEITVATLNGLIKIAREKSDMINEEEENDKGLCQKVNPCKENDYCFPSPTSVLPELMTDH